jgi:Holliday junction resolvase RusA-like endonuclease
MSFTPKATADAENNIRSQLIRYRNVFFQKGVPLRVDLKFFITKPPSVSKKRIYPVTRPDIDNYVKLVCDALNQYLFEDDSQIVELHAIKAYGTPPRIEIEVEILG